MVRPTPLREGPANERTPGSEGKGGEGEREGLSLVSLHGMEFPDF